jgi:hypothetical protein
VLFKPTLSRVAILSIFALISLAVALILALFWDAVGRDSCLSLCERYNARHGVREQRTSLTLAHIERRLLSPT